MMIYRRAEKLVIELGMGDAARLGAVLASGRGQDIDQDRLRQYVLIEIGARVFGRETWYLELSCAAENAPTEHEMGIVKLFRQANAIRAEANGILKSCAETLGRLIDRAGPACATPKQIAQAREGSR